MNNYYYCKEFLAYIKTNSALYFLFQCAAVPILVLALGKLSLVQEGNNGQKVLVGMDVAIPEVKAAPTHSYM